MRYYKVVCYQNAKTKRWFWRIVASNGKIVADGAQGYASKSAVLRAVANLKAMFDAGRVKVVD